MPTESWHFFAVICNDRSVIVCTCRERNRAVYDRFAEEANLGGVGNIMQTYDERAINVAEMTQQPGWGVFVKWNLHSIDVDTRAEVRSGLFERPIFFLGQPLHHGATAKQ